MEKLKKNASCAAVIDIGSSSLSMIIGQLVRGEIEILERLEYPLALGKDTFSAGEIGMEKANEACGVIESFARVANEYNAGKIKAFSTTAVREAANRSFFIEQIKLRTGITVDILDDSGEKTYIYKEIIRFFKSYKIYKSPALIVYMGVGNLGISCMVNGAIPYTFNIKMGSLRMSELITSLRDIEEEYQIVIEDYLRGFKTTFFSQIAAAEFKHFISCGKEASVLARLCNAELKNGLYFIPKDRFISLYNSIYSMTKEEIADKYGLEDDTVNPLRYTITIYLLLMSATNAEKIVVPTTSVSDGMIYEMLKRDEASKFNKEFDRSTLLSANTMAARYDYDKEHAEYVLKYSLKIFDKLKKIHGLGARERLLLEVAAITHDVGKYVNIKNHYNHSYEIIRSSEIVGLDSHETELAANIAKYHSSAVPSLADDNYNRLKTSEQMIVAKLSAILRIAEALDKGHIKKFDDIDLKISDNELIIIISTLKNTKVEEWSFNIKSAYFRTVFGMNAVLKKKRVK